jgi:hypothetical protein
MMHQIRMMHVFKQQHENDVTSDDPDYSDDAYEHISCSQSLHDLLNIIEDFEISNKRYTAEDKDIVEKMTLNGREIGGLVTEDHRDWADLALEDMYNELSAELNSINDQIRNSPNWQPKAGNKPDSIDNIEYGAAKAISLYADAESPSGIKAPIDVFIKAEEFNEFAPIYKKLVLKLYQ